MRRSGFRRRHKYGAIKTWRKGEYFDSKLEADWYDILLLLQAAGEISELERQKEFVINVPSIPEFDWNYLRTQKHYLLASKLLEELVRDRGIELKQICIYVADYYYFDKKVNVWVIADAKGVVTPEFRLKWKLMQALFPSFGYQILKGRAFKRFMFSRNLKK